MMLFTRCIYSFMPNLQKKNLERYLDLIGGEAACCTWFSTCLGGTCVTILERGCCACTIDFVTISDLTGGGGALMTTRLFWLAVTGFMRGTLDTAGVVAVTVLSWGTCWGICWGIG